MQRARFKICGIKTLEEARLAVAAGADMLGFVFAKGRHKITPEEALPIAREVPFPVLKVGVFVNSLPEEVQQIGQYCGLDVFQFHGEESPSYCQQFKKKVIKAFPVSSKEDLAPLKDYQVDSYLLDTKVKGKRGGTGRSFNWEVLRDNNILPSPLILAGGLNPSNIINALNITRVNIVDISSGVEKNGEKNWELLQQLTNNIRRFENETGNI